MGANMRLQVFERNVSFAFVNVCACNVELRVQVASYTKL